MKKPTLIEVSFFIEVSDAVMLQARAIVEDPELPVNASLAECCRVLLHPVDGIDGADILESTAREYTDAA